MSILNLSEENLEIVLQRSLKADGRFSQEDAAAAALLIRIIQVKSGGSFLSFANGEVKDYAGDLAAQSRGSLA